MTKSYTGMSTAFPAWISHHRVVMFSQPDRRKRRSSGSCDLEVCQAIDDGFLIEGTGVVEVVVCHTKQAKCTANTQQTPKKIAGVSQKARSFPNQRCSGRKGSRDPVAMCQFKQPEIQSIARLCSNQGVGTEGLGGAHP